MATRAVEKAFSIITPEDHNALHGIYRHRCLNDRQLAEYFYKDLDDGKNDYTLMRINELVENWLIDAHEYNRASGFISSPSAASSMSGRHQGVPCTPSRSGAERNNMRPRPDHCG